MHHAKFWDIITAIGQAIKIIPAFRKQRPGNDLALVRPYARSH